MPLHLLGKKSWNVYNVEKIARVQRDEAAARAAEEAEEQRMQERDSEHRLALLRGEASPPVKDDARETESCYSTFLTASSRNPLDDWTRLRRKRRGEDDTDFEMRLAREGDDLVKHASGSSHKLVSSAPIVDAAGYIDLIVREEGNGELTGKKKEFDEHSRRRQEVECENQLKMRFCDAAGRDAPSQPWYTNVDMEVATRGAPHTYVWANGEGGRKKVQSQRLANDDPLALIKKSASRIRELKQERQRRQQERDEELRALQRDHHDRMRDRRRQDETLWRRRLRSPSGRSDHHGRRSRDRHEGGRECRSHRERRRRKHERSPDQSH